MKKIDLDVFPHEVAKFLSDFDKNFEIKPAELTPSFAANYMSLIYVSRFIGERVSEVEFRSIALALESAAVPETLSCIYCTADDRLIEAAPLYVGISYSHYDLRDTIEQKCKSLGAKRIRLVTNRIFKDRKEKFEDIELANILHNYLKTKDIFFADYYHVCGFSCQSFVNDLFHL